MKKGLTIIGIIVVLGLWIGGIYNNMVNAEENVKGAWGQVENQYQRRLDLIDNLVETVKGFADQELDVFTQVTEARAKASNTNIDVTDVDELATFQNNQDQLSSALSRLLVTVEAYPELKSDQNFLELQAQLEGTENRIATARSDYLQTLASYNRLIRTVPNTFVAGLFGFDTIEYFEADEGAERAPTVDFGSTRGNEEAVTE